MIRTLTSELSPIRLDTLCRLDSGAVIFMSHAPGKKSRSLLHKGITWNRDLHQDLDRIKQHKIKHIFCLLETFEFSKHQMGNYPEIVKNKEINIHHYEIVDHCAPPSMDMMIEINKLMYNYLSQGDNILIHCAGGVGRTGTITSCFLVSLGHPPESAICWTQERRRGAIKRLEQQEFVKKYWLYLHNGGFSLLR